MFLEGGFKDYYRLAYFDLEDLVPSRDELTLEFSFELFCLIFEYKSIFFKVDSSVEPFLSL